MSKKINYTIFLNQYVSKFNYKRDIHAKALNVTEEEYDILYNYYCEHCGFGGKPTNKLMTIPEILTHIKLLKGGKLYYQRYQKQKKARTAITETPGIITNITDEEIREAKEWFK